MAQAISPGARGAWKSLLTSHPPGKVEVFEREEAEKLLGAPKDNIAVKETVIYILPNSENLFREGQARERERAQTVGEQCAIRGYSRSGLSHGPPIIAAQAELDITEISKRAMPATAVIEIRDARGFSSGFAVYPSGPIFSSLDVFENVSAATVRFQDDRELTEIKIVGFAQKHDLIV